MEIRLLVIRTSDIDRLASSYELFGLEFEYHKHEKSPYHYSASIGNTVLEIYPLAKGQAEPDKEQDWVFQWKTSNILSEY